MTDSGVARFGSIIPASVMPVWENKWKGNYRAFVGEWNRLCHCIYLRHSVSSWFHACTVTCLLLGSSFFFLFFVVANLCWWSCFHVIKFYHHTETHSVKLHKCFLVLREPVTTTLRSLETDTRTQGVMEWLDGGKHTHTIYLARRGLWMSGNKRILHRDAAECWLAIIFPSFFSLYHPPLLPSPILLFILHSKTLNINTLV